MNINGIELFDDENFLNQNNYKICFEEEIRKALASVLASSDIDIVLNTNKFIKWCKKNSFLLDEKNSQREKYKDIQDKI